jgi:glycosyltransferase involved in cell wall biosynthesis
MNKPLISVVLPVYNCEKYISAAIDSILKQTFNDFELIIINDGSSDRSEQLILSFSDVRIKYIKQENKGLAKTLNYGVSVSQGEFIARMDADDISEPFRFERQFDVFKKNPDVGIVSSNVQYINEEGSAMGFSLSYTSEMLVLKALKKGNVIFHPSVMFKKDIFELVGGYDEVIGCYFEDYLLWLEMLRKTRIAIIRKPLVRYRILPNSLSRSKPLGMNSVERKVAIAGGYYDGLYMDFKDALNTDKLSVVKRIKVTHKYLHWPLSFIKNMVSKLQGY